MGSPEKEKSFLLKQQLIVLQPWHTKVDICGGLSTDFAQTAPAKKLTKSDGY